MSALAGFLYPLFGGGDVSDAPAAPISGTNKWIAQESNTPYHFPYGNKRRNPWFIGPFTFEDQSIQYEFLLCPVQSYLLCP